MAEAFRADSVRRSRHVLRPLSMRGSVQGLLLQQRFPADKAPERTAYAAALHALLGVIEPKLSDLKREVFAQLAGTGRESSIAIRELGPNLDDFGLGIHPEAEPPRTWNSSDFDKITLNDKLPPLFHEVMRASSRRKGAAEAVWNRFFGTGTAAEAYMALSHDFYAEATAQFKPRITNRTARMFPYHAPLIRRRAAELAAPEELQQWMCGAVVYLREAVEEDGVLLLFRGDSAEILHGALRTNEIPSSPVEFLV